MCDKIKVITLNINKMTKQTEWFIRNRTFLCFVAIGCVIVLLYTVATHGRMNGMFNLYLSLG